MRALHNLAPSSPSSKPKSKKPKAKPKPAKPTVNMQTPLTPEHPHMIWSPESSACEETTPGYQPISPVSPSHQNLALEALADETSTSGTLVGDGSDTHDHIVLDKESDKHDHMEVDMEGSQEASVPGPNFRYDWLGTSQYSIESTINLHEEGKLDLLIFQRAQVLAEAQTHPYDPTPLLTLAYLDNCLGFSDIAVSNSYRALLLINAAFNIRASSTTTPPNLGSLAQKAISLRMNSTSIIVVGDEMLALRLQAYTTLVTGLQGCTAFWDGLKQSKLALKLYPGDYKLLQLKAELEDGLEFRLKDLPENANLGLEGKLALLKTGKVYQRPYPWLDSPLSKRTMELVRTVNSNVALQGGNMQVRQAFFGPNADIDARGQIVEEGGDVGPLGLFATRDIEKGELVMVDKTIVSVSSRPTSSLEICDACQACLLAPYMDPSEVFRPSCCKDVAYCSNMCWETAKAAYHPLLCGRDFSWLYRNVKMDGRVWRRWRATCFLRIIAIIITSNSKLPVAQRVHPLAHPLVSRMTAAYSPNTLRPQNIHDWQFLEEVTIPTKILTSLGVNIFTSPFYSQETIQTIYWRCENNANQTKNHMKPHPEVSLFNINTNYLFYNHSCQPNIGWHGPPDDGRVMLNRGIEDEYLRPGESAIWSVALKDIKQGEECKISYIGDPLGDGTVEGRAQKRGLLCKWCENGCGCTVCEDENAGVFKARKEVVDVEKMLDGGENEDFGGVELD